jgi:hypothetical protein
MGAGSSSPGGPIPGDPCRTVRRRWGRVLPIGDRRPERVFYAQGVKANVLFLDRKRGSDKPWTQTLWVYDFRTNRHFTLKESPLRPRGTARRSYCLAWKSDAAPSGLARSRARSSSLRRTSRL